MKKKEAVKINRRIAKGIENGYVEVIKGEDGTRYFQHKSSKEALPIRRSFMGNRIYYNCSKCGKVLKHTLKRHRYYCYHCGQALDSGNAENMVCVWLKVNDADEAFYWAGQYEYFNGDTYDIDIQKWRLIPKEFPLILFFPFPEGKAYGRFMRKAAKEAMVITHF